MQSDMPLLGGIAAFMRWLEELIVILSAPLLMFGLVVALVDLLTDGSLSLAVPWLITAWAVSQAVGVEANMSGAAFKIKASYQRGSWLGIMGYTVLVLSLAGVAVVAGYAFAYHQSQGVAIPQTLRDLGIDAASWTLLRSILSVVLVILSGLLRYTPQKAQAQDEAKRLQDEITLAPLRARAMAAKALGARTVVQAMVKGQVAPATTPLTDASQESDPYTQETETPSGEIEAIRLVVPSGGRTPPRRRRKRAPRGATSWEMKARSAWQEGSRTVGQLENAVEGMSHTAAQYWAGVFRAEERGAESARRQA